ncbi:MAG: ribokinase [Planctomycetota bacterium]|nr:ribokinase [Planctomycetota bacterium]
MTKKETKGITVIGSINIDFTVRADRLPAPGESVIGHEFFQAFGGKGANQAVGISRLGINPVHFVGAVGNDEIGKSALASLVKNGVSTEFVRTIDGYGSGVALIMIDSEGENCISGAPGANQFVDEIYLETLPDHLFQQSSLIVICQEIPLKTIAVAIQRARTFSVPVLFNPAPPNPELQATDLLESVSFLTPNETEVTAITGISIEDPGDTQNKLTAMKNLVERGIPRIAITMGSQGCFVYDKTVMKTVDESIQLQAPKTQAIDTTAAGDSFNAALAVAIHAGKPFLEACRWANQVASISVTKKGAQPSLPSHDEVSRIKVDDFPPD